MTKAKLRDLQFQVKHWLHRLMKKVFGNACDIFKKISLKLFVAFFFLSEDGLHQLSQ
jgi:hypothetical protein